MPEVTALIPIFIENLGNPKVSKDREQEIMSRSEALLEIQLDLNLETTVK